jgi:aerobic C4-dicarboxylate transport protein
VSGAAPRPGVHRQLWFQVLVGMVAGVALGWLAPNWGAAVKPLGDAFIALVRMMIAPVVFLTVVHGVAGANQPAKVGRVALKALAYFMVVTLLALLIALVAVDLIRPGDGMHVNVKAIDTTPLAAYAAQARHQDVVSFLLDIIPATFAGAFVGGNVLQVLFVALLFGFALGRVGERAQPLISLIETLNAVLFRIVGFIMWAAPIGAFGAIAFTVAKFGLGSLVNLGGLIAELYGVSALFTAVVLGGVAWAAGFNLLKLLAYLRDEILVVAATTSTETVLPRLMQKLRDAGCEEEVVGIVVPTGYSFNLDGTCLYLSTAAMFLAQATGTQLSLGQQLAMVGVMLVSSKGAAAVPGAAFVVLLATLSAVGTVPVASIALILGVHRLLAEAMTFVNLTGNAVAAIVICRWEKALDLDRLKAVLGGVRESAA